ncbi:MAG: BlaI/MecI/CopY family transcriptional regulator [Lachnospiraceae bacterium]|nr:BlaI/MecI/CopY family transcriptional regulator [Lachnospiraceae bacterium]
MKYITLTASETLVMKCIWSTARELSLADIFEMVNKQYRKNWKYQTVSTFLAKLVQKRFVCTRREGHRILYQVLITEADYCAEQALEFINFWNKGSVSQFVLSLCKERKLTKQELKELKIILAESES